MNHQQTQISTLAGLVTDLRQYPKHDTTRVVIDNTYLAFVKGLLEGVFLGVQINLTGSWRLSPKPTIGKYFAAQDYNVPPKRVRKKRNLPLARRLFGKKEVPERAQATIDRLESLLWYLLENKRKALAKKIALKVRPEDALDVRDNPYTLYLKKMLDFSTAEVLALKEYESGAQMDIVHPDRLKSVLSEVLKDAYNEGHTFLPIAEVQERVSHRLDGEVQITPEAIEGVKKSVAVIEEGNVYSPKIYYLRKKTISMLSNNVETAATHDNEIVRDLLRHRYSIITGPAGSGKTTALKAVAQLEGQRIALTALTGKAASLLGDEAQTLHRLLGFGHGGFSVTQLDYSIVIVDEASMMDWYTAFALFRAARGRVILCGDANQLPPVKGGSVFAELLEHLPVVTLDKVYRFLNGKNNVVVIERENCGRLVNTVINLALKLQKTGDDFQVITPVKSNMIGTYNLNRVLQKYLNGEGQPLTCNFKRGDRVIVTKNCYNKEIPVFNGQVGYIVDKDGEHKDSVFVKLATGVTLPFYEREIELAYCLTVHKAQGSQFQRVIFVSPNSQYEDFLDERMIYTGQTRGVVKTYVIKA